MKINEGNEYVFSFIWKYEYNSSIEIQSPAATFATILNKLICVKRQREPLSKVLRFLVLN